jgi:hypothetical protein
VFKFPFPKDQAAQCRAFDRRGSTDALILGAKVVNGMRGNRFSVQVETAIFDPNASGMSGESCKRPVLECNSDNKWEVTRLPDVKTSTGGLQSAKKYVLMTNADDAAYALLGDETKMIPKPPAGAVPSAVVESDYVKLKYNDGTESRTVDIHYDRDDSEAAIGLSWKSGTFHELKEGGNVQRLYAVSGSVSGNFAPVTCDPSRARDEGNRFLSGTASAGRKLLSHSGASSGAVAIVGSAPGVSNNRRLLNYGHHPLEYYLPYSVSGGFSRTFQIDEDQVITQVITDQEQNAVATSTVNVVSGHDETTDSQKKGSDRHDRDHDHDDDDGNSTAVNVWVMLTMSGALVVICLIAFAVWGKRERGREPRTFLLTGQTKTGAKPSKRNQDDFRLI